MDRNTISRLLRPLDTPYQPTTETILCTPPAEEKRMDFEPLEAVPEEVECLQLLTSEADQTNLTQLAKRPCVDIEFHDLSYTVRNTRTARDRKPILKNLSGKFRSGELTAIIGPSGAGKSSLLNILVGLVSSGVTGEIKTNGHPRKMRLFHKLSTYIMQEDLLQPRLTVDEAMKVAADLKLGDEVTSKQKAVIVDEILNTLGLLSSKEILTERLSGGQRKRLSIALELANNPPVIFLDEPTTGLDIVSIKQCVTLLKVLAGQGRTVVCTIHQPNASLFALFDQVYTMASGQCVYQGTSSQLVPYLARVGLQCPMHYNPADYVMELIQGEYQNNITKLAGEIQNGKLNWKGNPNNGSASSIGTKFSAQTPDYDSLPAFNLNTISENHTLVDFPTSFASQFIILIRRMCIQTRRNKVTLWIQLFHHLLSAFLLGGVYFDTGDQADKPFMNFKFSLSVLVFFMYTYIMTPVLLFPIEVKLLEREYFNRWYGLKSYFCALTIASIPAMILFGLVFLSVSYTMSSQPMDLLRFIRLAGVGILLAASSEAFGMVVGSLFSIRNGSIVAPASVSPLLALAAYGMGHGMTIEPLMNALMSLSYLRYGLVGISTALYGHDRPNMHCILPENSYCHYQNPALLLRDLGMENLKTSHQMLALIVFYFIFRLVAYLALRYRLTREFSGRLLNYLAKMLRQK